MFATQKDGVSALSLQKALEIGSYQTAWAMLHRLRSVLVRPGRERLTGEVEVDELFIGGEEPHPPVRMARAIARDLTAEQLANLDDTDTGVVTGSGRFAGADWHHR